MHYHIDSSSNIEGAAPPPDNAQSYPDRSTAFQAAWLAACDWVETTNRPRLRANAQRSDDDALDLWQAGDVDPDDDATGYVFAYRDDTEVEYRWYAVECSETH